MVSLAKNASCIQSIKKSSTKSGVYHRIRHPGCCARHEPRFKPPRERLPSGERLKQNHLPLGGYDTFEDARIVRQIAAFYYGKADPSLDLGDGRHFAINSSWSQHLDVRRGKEKAKWVASKAKEVFLEFKKAKASSGMLNASSNHTSVNPSGEQIANARDSSHSGLSSPALYKSPENRASSSRMTLLGASNVDEQRFVDVVLDEGDGVVTTELSGDVEYFPISSPLPVTHNFIEPKFSPLGLLENTELLGACLEDFTDEQLVERNGAWLDDFLSPLPDSIFDANGHPECSAVNATANELRASLFEPGGPCSPVLEVTALKENEGSCVEAAITDKMSPRFTTVPVEGALPTSQGLQSAEDGMDVGAPLSNLSFCSELSKEDLLFKLLSFYRKECGDLKRENAQLKREHCETRKISGLEHEKDKRRICELEREAKRLKGKSPNEIYA